MTTIRREWAMPNRWTFQIKPIRQLLEKYHVNSGWVDPFCGENSPAEFRNDLNPNNTHAQTHFDAHSFLSMQPTEHFKGALFDPPYSPRQVKECYDGIGLRLTQQDTQQTFWSYCKDEFQRIIQPDGIVICFGWNSMGVGKCRGFEMLEILLVPHGGNKNDTIVTVERKVCPYVEFEM